jgi:hypothetical protein
MKMRSLKAVSVALCALMLVAFSARDYEHLLDYEGIIRYIHPGGDYVKGEDDYKAMQLAIEEQLQRVEAQQPPIFN